MPTPLPTRDCHARWCVYTTCQARCAPGHMCAQRSHSCAFVDVAARARAAPSRLAPPCPCKNLSAHGTARAPSAIVAVSGARVTPAPGSRWRSLRARCEASRAAAPVGCGRPASMHSMRQRLGTHRWGHRPALSPGRAYLAAPSRRCCSCSRAANTRRSAAALASPGRHGVTPARRAGLHARLKPPARGPALQYLCHRLFKPSYPPSQLTSASSSPSGTPQRSHGFPRPRQEEGGAGEGEPCVWSCEPAGQALAAGVRYCELPSSLAPSAAPRALRRPHVTSRA